ncbi:MAG: TlpA disulfide reductase family protein [Limisphaerales bacterium]
MKDKWMKVVLAVGVCFCCFGAWPRQTNTVEIAFLYEKYHDQGLVVLGVNSADDRKIALDYLKANHVTFPIILDTSPAGWEAMAQYETLLGMSAVPMTCVIGRDGKIVDAWYGYESARTQAAVKKLGL